MANTQAKSPAMADSSLSLDDPAYLFACCALTQLARSFTVTCSRGLAPHSIGALRHKSDKCLSFQHTCFPEKRKQKRLLGYCRLASFYAFTQTVTQTAANARRQKTSNCLFMSKPVSLRNRKVPNTSNRLVKREAGEKPARTRHCKRTKAESTGCAPSH